MSKKSEQERWEELARLVLETVQRELWNQNQPQPQPQPQPRSRKRKRAFGSSASSSSATDSDPGKPLNATATNAIFELVYQIGSTSDAQKADRITMLLTWLTDVAQMSFQNNNNETPIPTFVYCVSCVLWPKNGAGKSSDLSPLISSSLFDLLLQWSTSLPISSILKRAVDRVLCAIYVVKPENYILLLKQMSIVKEISEDNPAPKIDVKSQSHYLHILPEEEKFFDLYSSVSLTDMSDLFLSEKIFSTLATISQSRIAVQQLIGCGFLGSLANVVSEFCLSAKLGEGDFGDVFSVGGESSKRDQKRPSSEDRLPILQIDTISAILDFFSELCWEGLVRKWLGSSEVSVFWEHLLEYLCKTVPSSYTLRNDLPSESLSKLEDTTIKFLSRCCWCYPKNQKTLASIVYNVIDATPRRYSKYNLGVTDFTRRVLLQLVLETEKIFVSVEGNLRDGINWQCSNGGVLFPPPPGYPPSSRQQLLYLNTSYSCIDIINKVIGTSESSETATAEVKMINPEDFIDVEDDVMDEYCDKITLAAGVTAKDKRLKDTIAGSSSRDDNSKKMKKSSGKDAGTWANSKDRNLASSKLTLWVPSEQKFIHVGQELTISQMLQILYDRGNELEVPVIKFLIIEQNDDSIAEDELPRDLLEAFGYAELPSVLKEFVETRGLEMVAHRLPMVYPTHYLRMVSSPYDTPTCSQNDPSWVKLDVNDDIYEEVMDDKAGTSTMNMTTHPEKRILAANDNLTMPSVIPPHSLMAFGQFLKLPNYAEWLIRDRKQAQCLLRLVLGGGDEADFNIANDPAKSLILNSLPTLPFEILRYLFKSTPINSDEGLNLRIAALKHGAVHVILACLAIFTHQPEAIHLADSGNQHVPLMMALKQCCSNASNKKSEDKSHQYWAKGTGFGTGSTTQSWNVEQALCRQRFEEEHVTVFLQILACYINPDLKLQDQPLNYICEDLCVGDQDEGFSEQPKLPSLFIDLIKHSCLLSALASYLRNDSVLDMARHIPLYRSILVLLRVMALNSQLVKFLLPTDYSNRPCSSKDVLSNPNDQTISLVELLQRMKTCVDTYSSRLKKNRGNGEAGSQHDSLSFKPEDEEDSGEGLATLIPDIRTTATIVEIVTQKILSNSNLYGGNNIPELNASAASVDETYLKIMKNVQFDTFDMISEDTDGLGLKFNVSYHFEPNLHSDADKNHPARMKRLAQEAVTLSTSLPLSYSSSVFVRCDTDRLDVMKVLITGPAETPYANGCFEFDVYFPPDYPNSPMLINLETTGRHSVRFNPNLYNDGKVCLSVLNTWHGRPEEKWNAHTSSFLQVLVSIQSLILVPEPYFNEPGYERSRGTASGNQNSREYNANIMQATVRWAMLDQIRNPSPCFRDIIRTHFWLKRNEITNQITNWINEIENEVSDNSKTSRNLSHGTMSLKCHFKMLCDEFAKLTPPTGLEELNAFPQFAYKAPSSPATLPSVVELSTAASTSAPSTSSLPLTTYAQMEKIITELLD